MKNMDEAQFIAEKQGQMAIKMVEISTILSRAELTEQDRERLQFCLGYILNVSMGRDKGFSTEISTIARAVALRTLNDMYADFGKAQVVPFGNGGHIVFPKEKIGKSFAFVELSQ
jgi:putative transposon-encoded protein